MNEPADITQLLVAWKEGDGEALEQLIPMVEKELRKIARGYMRNENPGHTLQTTALVNEAYFKLIDQKRVKWKNRSHFFAIAAKCMKRFLLDHAKANLREKRGGKQQKVSFSEVGILSPEKSREIIALDEALEALAKFAPRQARVVELKYFGGATAKETAEEMGISVPTVNKDWAAAKAWITVQLKS